MIKSESYKKGVVVSTLLNVFAKGIGFLNTLIIAYYFGTNIQTDIYFFVFTVALLLTGIINGMDGLILVPEGMKLREQEGETASQEFYNFFVYLYAGIGLLLATVIFISPGFFYSLFSKFETQALEQNSNLLYIGIIIIVFQLLNSLLSTILISYKYFSATILTGLINSVFAITFTLVFHSKFGIAGTLLGISIGYAINFILLILIMKRYQKWDFLRVKWMKKKEVWGNIGLMQVNVLPIWIRNTIALYLLSGLGHGIITAVNLGQQVSAIPDILIIAQLISIASIKFNSLSALKSHEELNAIFLRVCEWGISITMFISFVFILFSTELIGLLYGRNSITPDSLRNIEIVFAFSIACLSVKFIASICTNLITSAQKVRATFFMSVITHSLVTIAIYFLIQYFGLIGYLVGINLHFYLFFLFFYVLLKKTMPYIEYRKIFKLFFVNLLNNAIVFSLIFTLYYYQLKQLNNAYLIMGIGILLYSLLTIGVNELITANKYLKVKNIYRNGFKRIF